MQILIGSALSFLAATFALAEHESWAGWSLTLSGRIERVVSTGDHVAAVRGQSVILMHDDGSRMGQLTDPEIASRSRPSHPAGRAQEDILDFLGIDESEQDSAWVEDELNNESTLMQRRQRREDRKTTGAANSGLPAIAAGHQDIWIANGRGLWSWSGSGSLLQLTNGPLTGSSLSAASDGQVLFTTGHEVKLFIAGDGIHHLPGGTTIRHVAISASGRWLAWSSGSKLDIHEGADDPGHELFLSQSANGFRYCGEDLVLLSHDGLSILSAEGSLVLAAPGLSAHRLTCSDGTGPWLAVGPDISMSDDRGHTWTSIVLPIRAQVLDAAVGADCLWVATDKGLYRASGTPSPGDSLPMPATTLVVGPTLAPWWAAWLPQITIAGGGLLARGRRDIQTVAFASFPLDSPTPRRSFRLVADNTEVPIAHEPRPLDITLPSDPDAECLALTRGKAVSLAMVEPDRARSYVYRAGRAAWLPELRLRVDRRFGRSESLDVPSTSTTTTSPLGVDTVDDVRYEARVTWDLARLVFSNDELAAQSQTMHMAEMRRDIEVTVTRLYFERRRLRLERASAGTPERNIRRDLRTREIEAELDAISGGAFSQCTTGRTIGEGSL